VLDWAPAFYWIAIQSILLFPPFFFLFFRLQSLPFLLMIFSSLFVEFIAIIQFPPPSLLFCFPRSDHSCLALGIFAFHQYVMIHLPPPLRKRNFHAPGPFFWVTNSFFFNRFDAYGYYWLPFLAYEECAGLSFPSLILLGFLWICFSSVFSSGSPLLHKFAWVLFFLLEVFLCHVVLFHSKLLILFFLFWSHWFVRFFYSLSSCLSNPAMFL